MISKPQELFSNQVLLHVMHKFSFLTCCNPVVLKTQNKKVFRDNTEVNKNEEKAKNMTNLGFIFLLHYMQLIRRVLHCLPSY